MRVVVSECAGVAGVVFRPAIVVCLRLVCSLLQCVVLYVLLLLLFILYVCVTQRFEFFKEKRYINIYYYYCVLQCL